MLSFRTTLKKYSISRILQANPPGSSSLQSYNTSEHKTVIFGVFFLWFSFFLFQRRLDDLLLSACNVMPVPDMKAGVM